MNRILKLKQELLEEARTGANWTQDGGKMVERLSSYTTSLLQAIKEAGPGEWVWTDKPVPQNDVSMGHVLGFNDCRSQFHSLLDEGIEASKH